jgi:hypothetical protein
MKYYSKGALSGLEDAESIKKCLKAVCNILAKAFDAYGFVHNDMHS